MDLGTLQTNLDKLKAGCLFRYVQKQNTEPQNIVLAQVSKELRFLERQSEYANEIERVLKEIRLTAALIKECQTREPVVGISRHELLAYYQGVLLALVHQIKDKIVQLVHLMTEETVPDKPSIEKDVSVADLLRKKQQMLRGIGIEEEIKQWEQENPSSKIAVALRKRTHHHHRISGLRYDKDFVNLGFTEIATQPNFQDMLTDYGKEHIEKMRLESTERLFSGALAKAEDTLGEIEGNVERISAALVNYFKLPISQEEVAKIVNEHSEMLSSFDVVNRSSADKIAEPYKILLEALTAEIREAHQDQCVAIYLVGSLGRGEFEEGYSDINVYVILNIPEAEAHAVREDEIFSVRVFSRAHFLSEQCQKYRVIAKADGVLLHGEDLIKEEEMPKASLFLALVLNDDLSETLDQAKEWMEDNPTASPFEISKKSRRLAKRFLDFIYGVVMANKPQYTSSRMERIERINEMFPGNKGMIETLVGISRYGVGECESFRNMIEGFRPKAEMNLKKMRDVEAHIEQQGASEN